MAETLYELAVRFFADMAPLTAGLDKAEREAVNTGNRIGDKAGRAIGQKMGQAAAREASANFRREVATAVGNGAGFSGGMVGSSLLGGGGAVGLGGTLLGGAARSFMFSSNQAAQMRGYQEALTGIAGNADTAKKALEELNRIAGRTNFSTSEVMSLGVRMAGRDGDVSGLPAHIRSQLDAATAFGVRGEDFNEYQYNLTQMMNRKDNKIERDDYGQFINRAPRVTSAVSKAYGITVAEADKKIESLTGNQFRSLVEFVASKNKGLSERMGATTPQRVSDQIKDDISQGAAVTGELVNNGLMPMMNIIRFGVGQVKDFNAATGGAAGLVGILGIATVGVRLLYVGTRQAAAGVTELTSAISMLAAVSQGAAPRVGVSAAVAVTGSAAGSAVSTAGAAGAGAMSNAARIAARRNTQFRVKAPSPSGAGSGGGAFGPLDELQPFNMNFKGLSAWSKATTVAKNFGKGLLGLAPLAVSYGLSYGADKADAAGNMALGGRLRASANGVSQGSFYGMIGGAIIGGLIGLVGGPAGVLAGAAIGSQAGNLVGGAIGGIGAAIQYKPEDDPQAQAARAVEKNTDALQRNTDAVKDQTAKTVGGGERIKWAGTQAMLEWSAVGYGMPNRMASGIG